MQRLLVDFATPLRGSLKSSTSPRQFHRLRRELLAYNPATVTVKYVFAYLVPIAKPYIAKDIHEGFLPTALKGSHPIPTLPLKVIGRGLEQL